MAKSKEPSKTATATKKTSKASSKAPAIPPKTSSENADYPPSKEYYCSFCKKSSTEVLALIAGPNNIFICDNCIEFCVAVLLDDDRENRGKVWQKRIFATLANPSKLLKKPKRKPRKKPPPEKFLFTISIFSNL
jgi:hypothetical protein